MIVGFIIIGFILIIATATICVTSEVSLRTSGNKKSTIPAIILGSIGVILIILGFCFVTIPTGYTGVKTTFGQIHKETLPNGMNFRIPFVQSIEKVNNKQQDITIGDSIWGETSEKVQVYMSNITVTYRINPDKSAWIFANVTDYEENLIAYSLVSSALKNSVAVLPANQATIRSYVEPLAQESLQLILDEKYGEDVIIINKVAIADMNFEDSYNTAISQRNMAELIQQRQSIENTTAIEKAEADKKVQVTAAEAEAQVMLTKAQAEKEANELRESSLTDRILISQALEKWNGELPRVTGSGESILDISSVVKER